MRKKGPEFQLAAPYVADAIRASVKFANVEVKSARQVLQIFQRAGLLPRFRWDSIPPKLAEDLLEKDYKPEQHELRGWLTKIVLGGNVVPDVRAEVTRSVSDTMPLVIAKVVFERGQLGLSGEITFTSIQAIYSYAVMQLVSVGSDRLAAHLGQCKRCGQFFFDGRFNIPGRRKDFCCDDHRNQLNVWKYNNRHKAWKMPELP